MDAWMDGTTGFVVNLRGGGTRLNEGLRFMRAIGRILSACPWYAGLLMMLIAD